jgi:hypothetical protein
MIDRDKLLRARDAREGDTMRQDEKLARQAIKLENALFLRWFTCRRTGNPEYVARLASVRRKTFARVFRRQAEAV